MGSQKKKEIDNTEDFFKKLSNKNAAISIYKINNDKLEITIGVYKEIQNYGYAGIPMSGFAPGSFGTFGGGHYFPVYGYYQGYKNSKAVYFKSLINAITFEHIKDSLKPNIFDRVDTFLENAKEEMYKGFPIPINYDIIFKKDNIHYFGYLRNYQNYYFYRFKEDN